MKAVVIEKPGELALRDVGDTKVDDYQALVRTLACSICNGTDMKIVDGTIPFFGPEGYPGLLGHESVGRVVRTGRKVTAFNEGDLVLRAMADVEGFNCCWGGFAEFGTVTDLAALEADGAKPSNRAHHKGQQVIPADADLLEATICITLKEVLSYLRGLHVKAGDSLLVLGYGPVGLSFANLAKVIGMSPVIVAGRRQDALRQATKFGADETVHLNTETIDEKVHEVEKEGVDFIVDAAGVSWLVEESAKALKPGGKIGLYAVVDSDKKHVDRKAFGSAIANVGPDEASAHEEVMRLWQEGRIQPEKFISHVLSIADVQTGFDLVRNRQAMKVVLNIGG